MKNIVLTIILSIGFALSSFAQSAILDSLKTTASKDDNGINITFPGWSIQLATFFAGKEIEDEKVKQLLSKAGRVNVFTHEGSQNVKSLTRSIKRELLSTNYETLMEIREGGTFINALLKADGNDIKKIILLIDDEGETLTTLEIDTKMTMDDLEGLNLN